MSQLIILFLLNTSALVVTSYNKFNGSDRILWMPRRIYDVLKPSEERYLPNSYYGKVKKDKAIPVTGRGGP
jgi:hypothetical protein